MRTKRTFKKIELITGKGFTLSKRESKKILINPMTEVVYIPQPPPILHNYLIALNGNFLMTLSNENLITL